MVMNFGRAAYRSFRQFRFRVIRRLKHHFGSLFPAEPEVDVAYFLPKVRGVIHVGANSGQERDLYAANNLNVLWVEALPDVFVCLQRNINSYPKQRAVCALVTDKAGDTRTFNVANNEGESSSIYDLGLHAELFPSVRYEARLELPTTTLDTIMSDHQLAISNWDALVMDTQGSELLVLKGATKTLEHIRYIKTEAADFDAYLGQPRVRDLTALLGSIGFTLSRKKITSEHLEGGRFYELVFERTTLT